MLSDNEIIKALEDYKNSKILQTENGVISIGDILGLINRQKQQLANERATAEIAAETISRQDAEIKRLEKTAKIYNAGVIHYKALYKTAKSEAIKEFASKYEKSVLPLLTSATLDKKDGIHACLDILKEMVGDDK